MLWETNHPSATGSFDEPCMRLGAGLAISLADTCQKLEDRLNHNKGNVEWCDQASSRLKTPLINNGPSARLSSKGREFSDRRSKD